MTLKGYHDHYLGFVAAFLLVAFSWIATVEAGGKINVIVPLGKGGALDRFARTAEQFLPNVMDVEVSVENFSPKKDKDGYREFLNGPKDGSNLLAWFEPAAAAYEPGVTLGDLAIINVQELEPPILAARSDVGWNNLGEMVRALRATPNQYRFGFGSASGGGPLLTSALLSKLNLKVIRANYPSGGKARKAVATGEVDLTAGSLNALRKLGDHVTPLAVFSPRRLRAWPEVPTIREALGPEADKAVHGAVYRFYAVHQAFAEAEPEAFANLVEAFRRMTEEDSAFLRNADNRGVGALWFGPTESTSLIQRSHQHFGQLVSERQVR